MQCMRLLYGDRGGTAYYGIGDSKFRKILEMTFFNAARPSSFADRVRDLWLNLADWPSSRALYGVCQEPDFAPGEKCQSKNGTG